MKKVPIPIVVPIPAWIRIWVIPIPTLFVAIPNPDPDPLKRGIVTSLAITRSLLVGCDRGLQWNQFFPLLSSSTAP